MINIDLKQIQKETFLSTVLFIEKAIKWFSPLILLGIVGVIMRMLEHGGKWSTYIQIILILLFFLVFIIRKRLPIHYRFLHYVFCIMLVGLIGMVEWGLMSQGLLFILLGIVVASSGNIRYWLTAIITSLVLIIAIGYGYITGFFSFNRSVDLYMHSISPWIMEIMVFSLTALASLIWLHVIKHSNEREVELIKSEHRFRNLFENSILGIYRTTPKGEILLANSALLHMLGFKTTQALQKRNLEKEGYPPQYSRNQFKEMIEKDGKVVGLESLWTRADGSILHVRENAIGVFSNNGELVYYEGTVEDITEKKLAEERLELFQSVVKASSDAIGISTPEGEHWYQNKTFDDLFGEIGIDPPATIYVDPSIGRQVFDSIMNDKAWTGEVEMYDKNRNIVKVLLRAYAFRGPDDQISGLVGVHTDITEIKQAEEKIKSSLREKEVMLKEIHHRVKNNLQIINSLIYLQSLNEGEKLFKESAKELTGRIQSMAFIHEMLYQSKSMADIHMPTYLESLFDSIQKHLGQPHISIKHTIEELSLDIEQSVPLGLIINEVITNAYKHAFPDGKPGHIHLQLTKADKAVLLIIKDDGIGYPDGFETDKPASLGLKLINILAKQLGARLELYNDHGAVTRLEIPLTVQR